MIIIISDGQAQQWSEWNLALLNQAIPQLYARVLLRFAKFTSTSLDMLAASMDGKTDKQLNPEDAENAAERVLKHFYNSWPDPKEVTPLFRQLLPEFVRHVKVRSIISVALTTLIRIKELWFAIYSPT